MACEAFTPKTFTPAHKQVIRQANQIAAEYREAGYTMTLRQIHYQFVARDLYENTQQNYKRLGNILNAARLAGLFDWDLMEDRTRSVERIAVWNTPEQAVAGLKQAFKLDPWDEQPIKRRIEVWPEKDAAIGIIEPTCDALRIAYYSCRGYSSSSGLYEAGKRLAAYRAAGYETLILYVGDHDPSGMQMTDSTDEKVNLFAGTDIEFRRIALTIEQVREYNPPANFVKETDSRTKWYVDQYGTEDCWELDALSPQVVDTLIRSHVEPLIDQKAWDATMACEAEHHATLAEIISDWKRTKAAPDMLDLLRAHGNDYFVAQVPDDEGSYGDTDVGTDAATLDLLITESQELLQKHELS